LDRTLW